MKNENGLNEKQQCFVREYLIDLNATQAAIRAGYSKKTAKQMGTENLSKPSIQEAIAEHIKKRTDRTEVTQDMVVAELAKIAFADMADYVEIDADGSVRVKAFDEMPQGASRAIAKIKDIRRLIGSSEGDGKDIILDARLELAHHNKERALELLGKHLGMFVEKHEHSGKLHIVESNIDI